MNRTLNQNYVIYFGTEGVLYNKSQIFLLSKLDPYTITYPPKFLQVESLLTDFIFSNSKICDCSKFLHACFMKQNSYGMLFIFHVV
jgi:hypothetical protein